MVQTDGDLVQKQRGDSGLTPVQTGEMKYERRSLPEVTGLVLALITPGQLPCAYNIPEPLWAAPLICTHSKL